MEQGKASVQSFLVKIRQSDGSLEELEFQAPNKSELLKMLSKRKVVAISIHSGKLSHETSLAIFKARVLRLLTIGVVAAVVALGIIACLLITSDTTVPVSVSPLRQGRIRENTPSPSISQATNFTNDATNSSDQQNTLETKEIYLGVPVVEHSYITNANGRSIREIIKTADGKRHGITRSIAKPTFKYGTDELLADILFPPKYGIAPPLPAMDSHALDKEFAKSLLDPIVVNSEDTAEIKMQKEAVRQARKELAELVKQGHTVWEVIQNQRKFNDDEYDMRLEVTKGIARIRQEGGSDSDILTYLDAANALLESNGMSPVKANE